MRRALVLAAMIAALAALPSTAGAACRSEVRWIPGMSGQTGGSLILVPVCDGTGKSTPSAKQRKPTAKQLRTLRYVPRESVSAKVRGIERR